MLHLDSHLGDLLVQGGYIVLTGQNVTLQLLDLVVEHELKLLQLLSLFLEFDDSGILILNCGPSGVEFRLLSLNLILVVVDGSVEST